MKIFNFVFRKCILRFFALYFYSREDGDPHVACEGKQQTKNDTLLVELKCHSCKSEKLTTLHEQTTHTLILACLGMIPASINALYDAVWIFAYAGTTQTKAGIISQLYQQK